ncbi:MAG: divalent cation tolerance protein CutA [Verrucomicrobiaceae bacterium]|nr:divalent cation tolerance protein CutA [Verrucomicrobiaceae bacterium]
MTEALVVLCSFPNREKARQVGTHLVERQYAACINILPAMESIYRWEGELCQEEEFMLVIKTSRNAFLGLSRELSSLHPHDEPEIWLTKRVSVQHIKRRARARSERVIDR